MGKQRIYFEVLDARRRAMLPRLQFLRDDYGFYLAGGTALALQIRHRGSVDFDFYTPREFKPIELYERLKRLRIKAQSRRVAEGTLMAMVGGIEMSFFRYPYPLLKPLVATESLDLLSLEDIAAMKSKGASVKMRGPGKRIPDRIARCLWSYDLSSIDPRWDRELIIQQVLNYGDWEDLKWLYRIYPERVIREAVAHPRRGMWFDEVLNFWCLMLKVRLPKRVKERALFRLAPQFGR